MLLPSRFLGLDISAHTGYAVADEGKIKTSGVRDFSINPNQHAGQRYLKFYNFLVSLGYFDAIFYEMIMFGGGGFKDKKTGLWRNGATNDGRELYHGLLAVVYMYGAGQGIPVLGVHPGTLKKAFTGSGNAKKPDMCRAAIDLGWQGGVKGTEINHDEADALALVITQAREKYGIEITF